MTNDQRSAHEIEREIEEQRSDLTSNLEDLQGKFSLDGVVRQVIEQFVENSGDIGRSIIRQAKENPIPLALTAVGLAWLIFGSSTKKEVVVRPVVADLEPDHMAAYSQAEHDYYASRTPYTPSNNIISTSGKTPSWALDDDDGVRYDD